MIVFQLMKKANHRKETEPNFEDKCLNLTIEEEREHNKENDNKRQPKDPYYDQKWVADVMH